MTVIRLFTKAFRISDFRLPPRSRWDLCSSGLLRSESWQFVTNVSTQPIGPIFMGQGECDPSRWYWLSRNVGKKLQLLA